MCGSPQMVRLASSSRPMLMCSQQQRLQADTRSQVVRLNPVSSRWGLKARICNDMRACFSSDQWPLFNLALSSSAHWGGAVAETLRLACFQQHPQSRPQNLHGRLSKNKAQLGLMVVGVWCWNWFLLSSQEWGQSWEFCCTWKRTS